MRTAEKDLHYYRWLSGLSVDDLEPWGQMYLKKWEERKIIEICVPARLPHIKILEAGFRYHSSPRKLISNFWDEIIANLIIYSELEFLLSDGFIQPYYQEAILLLNSRDKYGRDVDNLYVSPLINSLRYNYLIADEGPTYLKGLFLRSLIAHRESTHLYIIEASQDVNNNQLLSSIITS